ncbi:DNA repair protein rad2 [Thoreauomyces humboldtii]|nr:DNA repair protein rad2 [Thoreauomyces humboldtii]
MGVKGLWALLRAVGQAKRIETLYGTVVCIDVSIWNYKFEKGMKNTDGTPMSAAAIIGTFYRVCKMLFHGILPIFIFDGGTPTMKMATTAARRALRAQAAGKAEILATRILKRHLKLQALKKASGETTVVPNVAGDAYGDALTELPDDFVVMQGLNKTVAVSPPKRSKGKKRAGSPDEFEPIAPIDEISKAMADDPRLVSEAEMQRFVNRHRKTVDFRRINLDDASFQALSVERQHDIITDMKNQSRQASHRRYVALETAKDQGAEAFQDFQIQALVRRHKITAAYHGLKKGPTAPGGGSTPASFTGRREGPQRVAGERSREYVMIQNSEPGRTGYTIRRNARVTDDKSTATDYQTKQEGAVIDLESEEHEDVTIVEESNPQTVQENTSTQYQDIDADEQEEDEVSWETSMIEQESKAEQPLLIDQRAWLREDASVEEIEAMFAQQAADATRVPAPTPQPSAVPIQVYGKSDSEEEDDFEIVSPAPQQSAFPIQVDVKSDSEEEGDFETVSMEDMPNTMDFVPAPPAWSAEPTIEEIEALFARQAAETPVPMLQQPASQIIVDPKTDSEEEDDFEAVPFGDLNDPMDVVAAPPWVAQPTAQELAALLAHQQMMEGDSEVIPSLAHDFMEVDDPANAFGTANDIETVTEEDGISTMDLDEDNEDDEEFESIPIADEDCLPDSVTLTTIMEMFERSESAKDLGGPSTPPPPPRISTSPPISPRNDDTVEEAEEIRLQIDLDAHASDAFLSSSPEEACDVWRRLSCPELQATIPDHAEQTRAALSVWTDERLRKEVRHAVKIAGKASPGSPKGRAYHALETILRVSEIWRADRRAAEGTSDRHSPSVQPSPHPVGTGHDSPFVVAGSTASSSFAKPHALVRRLKVFRKSNLGESPENRVLAVFDEEAVEPAADASEFQFEVEDLKSEAVGEDDQGFYFTGFTVNHQHVGTPVAPSRDVIVPEAASLEDDVKQEDTPHQPLPAHMATAKPSTRAMDLPAAEYGAVEPFAAQERGLDSQSQPPPTPTLISAPSATSTKKFSTTGPSSLLLPAADKRAVEPSQRTQQGPAVPNALPKPASTQIPVHTPAPPTSMDTPPPLTRPSSVAPQTEASSSRPGPHISSVNEMEDEFGHEFDDMDFDDVNLDALDEDATIDVDTHLDDEQEETERFIAQLADGTTDREGMVRDLEAEVAELNRQKNKHLSSAEEGRSDITNDLMTLARICGIPYLVAPMEAEAQCAFLLANNLVDGIVSDDSDGWLFGATKILKNIFNHRKYVEEYTMDRIHATLHLEREKMVQMAYLLGSDYTPGIQGVGGTMSMEILNRWRGNGLEPLLKFREWWEGVRDAPPDAPIPEEDNTAQFRKLVSPALSRRCPWLQPQQALTRASSLKRKLLRDKPVPASFPDPRVWDAYYNPQVDTTVTPFTWGEPDVDALRDFMEEKTKGQWNQQKVDAILIPVMRERARRAKEAEEGRGVATVQTSLDKFFKVDGSNVKAHDSKRVRAIVRGWKGIDEQVPVPPPKKARAKKRARQGEDGEPEPVEEEVVAGPAKKRRKATEDADVSAPPAPAKKVRKPRAKKAAVPVVISDFSDEEGPAQPTKPAASRKRKGRQDEEGDEQGRPERPAPKKPRKRKAV